MVNPHGQRRRMLAALTAAGVALIGMRAARAADDTDAALGARLAALPRHGASAAAIGRAYLRLTPEEAATPLLAALVAANTASPARLLAARDGELRRILAAAQREDFRAGRTVSVRGWMLSRTEARLCALAALA